MKINIFNIFYIVFILLLINISFQIKISNLNLQKKYEDNILNSFKIYDSVINAYNTSKIDENNISNLKQQIINNGINQINFLTYVLNNEPEVLKDMNNNINDIYSKYISSKK